jgi:hypothetical protein
MEVLNARYERHSRTRDADGNIRAFPLRRHPAIVNASSRRREQNLAIPIPVPSILDDCEYLGAYNGQRRWRSDGGKRLYTWDALHGEIEVFNARGRHLGAIDPVTGAWIKEAVRGRRIDV